MKKKIILFLDGLLTVVLLLVLAFNIFSIYQKMVLKNDMPTLFGYGYATVISGSMEPTISVYDVVVFKAQDTYSVDDIITYEKYDSYITHRIVDIVDGEYIARGDYNNTEDSDPVMPEQVVGKVVWVIPAIGALILRAQTPVGMLAILLLALLCFELPYYIRLYLARKRGKAKYKEMVAEKERIKVQLAKLEETPAEEPAEQTEFEAVVVEAEEVDTPADDVEAEAEAEVEAPTEVLETEVLEVETEELSEKELAKQAAKEERRHQREVEKHRRKGPDVFVPEEGVWDIEVDEAPAEDEADE